jgi:hypothetical protein
MTGMKIMHFRHTFWGVVLTLSFVASVRAQNIGCEGETGILVTPLAYTAKSPEDGLGLQPVGCHFLNGGGVLGDFYNISGTVGALSRLESGYTRALHTLGRDPDFSSLWNNGFNIVHGKLNLVSENAARTNWIPAISVGFDVTDLNLQYFVEIQQSPHAVAHVGRFSHHQAILSFIVLEACAAGENFAPL